MDVRRSIMNAVSMERLLDGAKQGTLVWRYERWNMHVAIETGATIWSGLDQGQGKGFGFRVRLRQGDRQAGPKRQLEQNMGICRLDDAPKSFSLA